MKKPYGTSRWIQTNNLRPALCKWPLYHIELGWHMIRRTSLLITLAPYFIANFHGLSQNESQGVQFQSRASNVEFHLCYLAIVLPTFNACSPAKWVQIWESNPILGVYETRDLTACPICNNVSGERVRPLPFTTRNLRPVGYTGKKDGKGKVRTTSFSNSDTNTRG